MQWLPNEQFGDGRDGARVISSNIAVDFDDKSICTGVAGSKTLNATNTNFAAGQIILIHQTQFNIGSAELNPGVWELNVIDSYTPGTITTKYPLTYNYIDYSQVIRVPQYTNLTINTGITLTGNAWNRTIGGITPILVNGKFTLNGNINVDGGGFNQSYRNDVSGNVGEGWRGYNWFTQPNKNGGGGGTKANNWAGGGAGGGNGTVGSGGGGSNSSGAPQYSTGGDTAGNAALTQFVFGGGGGRGGDRWDDTSDAGQGGAGGGGVMIFARRVGGSGGVISLKGNAGGATTGQAGSGGGGAGGSLLVKGQNLDFSGITVNIDGGAGGGHSSGNGGAGGAGGLGRFHADYSNSLSGGGAYIDSAKDSSLADKFAGGMI